MATFHAASKPEDKYGLDFCCSTCDWMGRGRDAHMRIDDTVRCPRCFDPVELRAGWRTRLASWLHWLLHDWGVARDTGKTVYEQCLICGKRRAWQRHPGVGAQPVCRHWLRGEDFCTPDPEMFAALQRARPSNVRHPQE